MNNILRYCLHLMFFIIGLCSLNSSFHDVICVFIIFRQHEIYGCLVDMKCLKIQQEQCRNFIMELITAMRLELCITWFDWSLSQHFTYDFRVGSELSLLFIFSNNGFF